MKGRLNKLEKGWVVEYIFPGPPFVGELPILISDKISPKDVDTFVVGDEVEFEIIQMWVVENDQEFEKEFALVKPTLDEQEDEEYNYWKERCLAAEKFIDLTPCDPDIYDDQLIAHNEWVAIKNKQTN